MELKRAPRVEINLVIYDHHWRARIKVVMSIGSHVIPRFYLEQFATKRRQGKPGFVWVYEKGRPPRPSSTKAQGYENGYFTFVHPNGTRDESLKPNLLN